jgi:hypothetical protein
VHTELVNWELLGSPRLPCGSHHCMKCTKFWYAKCNDCYSELGTSSVGASPVTDPYRVILRIRFGYG